MEGGIARTLGRLTASTMVRVDDGPKATFELP